MIQWLNKMERKFGKYAIPDLTRYVVGAYCLGALLEMLTNFGIIPFDIYYQLKECDNAMEVSLSMNHPHFCRWHPFGASV